MKPEMFETVDRQFMQNVDHVLDGKGKAYTGMSEDRFDVFKKAAELGGTTQLKEALAYMRKHTIAFFKLFTTYEDSKVPPTKIQEHGGDMINYIRIINGMLAEGEEDNVYTACSLPDCSCHIAGELCIKETFSR